MSATVEQALQALIELADVEVERQYVQAGPYRTHYLTAGHGRAVILLHGAGGGAGTWFQNIGPLARHFRIYAPDNLGFGLSARPDFTAASPMTIWVSFLRDFMDAIGEAQAALIGESLGGLIVGWFAVACPERVDRLVLSDAIGLGPVLFRMRLAALPPLQRLMMWILSATRWGGRQRWPRSVYHGDAIPATWQEYVRLSMTTPDGAAGFLAAMRLANLFGWKPEARLSERLGQIEAPTLIIRGEYDTVVPLAHVRKAQALLPDARLHIIPECGHVPPIECPEAWNEAVLTFLLT